jgi:hypothetical protein
VKGKKHLNSSKNLCIVLRLICETLLVAKMIRRERCNDDDYDGCGDDGELIHHQFCLKCDPSS